MGKKMFIIFNSTGQLLQTLVQFFFSKSRTGFRVFDFCFWADVKTFDSTFFEFKVGWIKYARMLKFCAQN